MVVNLAYENLDSEPAREVDLLDYDDFVGYQEVVDYQGGQVDYDDFVGYQDAVRQLGGQVDFRRYRPYRRSKSGEDVSEKNYDEGFKRSRARPSREMGGQMALRLITL